MSKQSLIDQTNEIRSSRNILAARETMTAARCKFGMRSEQAIAAEREVMRLEAIGYKNEGVPLFGD